MTTHRTLMLVLFVFWATAFAPIQCWAAAAPPITAVAFAPPDQHEPHEPHVVVGSQRGVFVYSWPTLKLKRRLESRLDHIHDLRFSPVGDRLLAAGGTPAESGDVEVFSWPGGKTLGRFSLGDDLIYSVAWNQDSRRFAAAGAESSVWLCDEHGKIQQTLSGHSRAVLSLCWIDAGRKPAASAVGSKTNHILVSAGRDQTLRVWNPSQKKPVRTLSNHTRAVRVVARRPRTVLGQAGLPMIASAGADRTVRLWQPTIGRMVRFARLSSPALDLDWTPEGDRLLVSCVDGRVRVIDPSTVEIQAKRTALEGWAYCVKAAPDGRRALVAGQGGMKVVQIP